MNSSKVRLYGAVAAAVLLAAAGGYALGSLTARRKVQLVVEAPPPRPERDLSPRGEVRTVLVVRTEPGCSRGRSIRWARGTHSGVLRVGRR